MEKFIICFCPYGNGETRYYNESNSAGTNNRDSAKIYECELFELIQDVKNNWKCDCWIENFDTEEIEFSHKY